ncbi:MATE family efflux transporter [Clostridium sp. Marseille-QA1073]
MENSLSTKSIGSLFLKFVIPAIIGVLVNSVYIIVDGIFIGRGVGETGLAAINILWPVMCGNMAIGMLLGVGGSALIAIKLGQNEKEEARQILGTSVFSMILIGLIITIVGLLFLEPIMIFLGAEGEVLKLSKEYSVIIISATIMHILSTGLNPIARAEGNPKLSMNILVISAILNAFLDWLFVMKLGYGMGGAAAATIVGMTLSGLYFLYYFFSRKSKLHIRLKHLKIKFNILKEICISGFVSFGMQMSLGILTFIQNNLILHYGTTIDLAMFAIVGYVATIFLEILLGIAQGTQPIIGYNYGAEKYDRVKKTLRLALIVDIVYGCIALILLFIFATSIVNIFNDNLEFVNSTATRLKMYLGSLPFLGIVITYGSYYQSIQKDLYANIISIGRSFIFLVPVSFILPKFLGVDGVFLSPLVSDTLALATTIFIGILNKRKEEVTIAT